jgi:4-amino-4-deoxyprephenate dehydrogenase
VDAICEHRRGMQPTRFAIVGGDGAVGRLFVDALASDDAGHEVAIVDRAAAPPLDARRPSHALTDALARADCVLLAVPEAVALEALPHVLAALRPGALLADTLSVKSPFVAAAVERAAGRDLELLSLNPMFAPALGLDGRAVLAVEVTPGPRSDALLTLLRERATVVTVADADAHDRMAAALQVAAHASVIGFGLALAQLDADLDALLAVAPPPFVALLALLARIADGSPETYADIQLANPFAAEARAALTDGLAQLDAAAGGERPADVKALLARLHALLGDAREPLAEQAAALLAQVRPQR